MSSTMWTYHQRTGAIYDGNELAGYGYSGHGNGLNSPGMESVHDIGPLPAGNWIILEWVDNYPTKGPVVARLSPVENTAHGRSGFLIHGDNALGNHSASHGCIIAGRAIREAWRASGDTKIQVVP